MESFRFVHERPISTTQGYATSITYASEAWRINFQNPTGSNSNKSKNPITGPIQIVIKNNIQRDDSPIIPFVFHQATYYSSNKKRVFQKLHILL